MAVKQTERNDNIETTKQTFRKKISLQTQINYFCLPEKKLKKSESFRDR